MSKNGFSETENIDLAFAIKFERNTLSPEILNQMLLLKPIAEIMVLGTITDYFANPLYKDLPPSKRTLDQEELKGVKKLFRHLHDIRKLNLAVPSYRREVNRVQAQTIESITGSNLPSENFLTLNPDDVDALLSVGRVEAPDKSIPPVTAMGTALAELWKAGLYSPEKIENPDDALLKTYQAIHQRIYERLEIKRNLQLEVMRKRAETEMTEEHANQSKEVIAERSKYLFKDFDRVPDKTDFKKLYNDLIIAGQIILMVKEISNDPDPESLSSLVKLFEHMLPNDPKLSSARPNPETNVNLAISMLKGQLGSFIMSKHKLSEKYQPVATFDMYQLADDISRSYVSKHRTPESIEKIMNYFPKHPHTDLTSPVEDAGLDLLQLLYNDN